MNQGRHEFDGVFPDWSRDGIGKEAAQMIVIGQMAHRRDLELAQRDMRGVEIDRGDRGGRRDNA